MILGSLWYTKFVKLNILEEYEWLFRLTIFAPWNLEDTAPLSLESKINDKPDANLNVSPLWCIC